MPGTNNSDGDPLNVDDLDLLPFRSDATSRVSASSLSKTATVSIWVVCEPFCCSSCTVIELKTNSRRIVLLITHYETIFNLLSQLSSVHLARDNCLIRLRAWFLLWDLTQATRDIRYSMWGSVISFPVTTPLINTRAFVQLLVTKHEFALNLYCARQISCAVKYIPRSMKPARDLVGYLHLFHSSSTQGYNLSVVVSTLYTQIILY